MRWQALVLLVVVWAVGCGEDPAPLPDVSVGVGLEWKFGPPSQEELGFTMSVLLTQHRPQGATRCRQVPASARITIDGQDVTTLGSSKPDGCFELRFTKGPFLEFRNAPVTVVYEEEGRQIGQGEFRDLAPGTVATLAVPAGGEVRPGEQLTILPPPSMPTSRPGPFAFYPLDETVSGSWPPHGVKDGAGVATRSADGIHVTVPRMAGRVALWMTGMPYSPQADFRCGGFRVCTAIADNTLGPVLFTVAP